MEFTRKIEAEVEAGELSKQDAEKKLIEVRKEMFRSGEEERHEGDHDNHREMEAKKQRYMELTRKIEAAVEAGELPKQDAEKKLIEVRKEMFRSGEEERHEGDHDNNREMEAKKQRYMELTRKIEAAVEAGELPKEDAEKKLINARLEMFGDGDRTRRRPDDNDQSRGSTGEEDLNRQVAEAAAVIEAFEAKLNEQVKVGELSKADFDKKLLEYSNEVFAKIKR